MHFYRKFAKTEGFMNRAYCKKISACQADVLPVGYLKLHCCLSPFSHTWFWGSGRALFTTQQAKRLAKFILLFLNSFNFSSNSSSSFYKQRPVRIYIDKNTEKVIPFFNLFFKIMCPPAQREGIKGKSKD